MYSEVYLQKRKGVADTRLVSRQWFFSPAKTRIFYENSGENVSRKIRRHNSIVVIAVFDCGITFTNFKSSSGYYATRQGFWLKVHLRTL